MRYLNVKGTWTLLRSIYAAERMFVATMQAILVPYTLFCLLPSSASARSMRVGCSALCATLSVSRPCVY